LVAPELRLAVVLGFSERASFIGFEVREATRRESFFCFERGTRGIPGM
jgi:hypothetical protein